MQTLITKFAILFDLLVHAWTTWRTEVWAKDIDGPYCCSGRDCGCYGQTVRESFGR